MSHCTGYYQEPGAFEYPWEGVEFMPGKPPWERSFDEKVAAYRKEHKGENFEGHAALKAMAPKKATQKVPRPPHPDPEVEKVLKTMEDELGTFEFDENKKFNAKAYAKAASDLKKEIDEKIIPHYKAQLAYHLAHPEEQEEKEEDRTDVKNYSQEQDDAIWAALEPRLRERTKAAGIESFFPMQRAVLPATLCAARCRDYDEKETLEDICVAAPTGSGKTLIYALTLLQFLEKRRCKRIRALIVAPSRELAKQITKELKRFVPEAEVVEEDLIRVPAIDVRCETSKMLAAFKPERGDIPDILVATPGRLADRLDEENWLAEDKRASRYCLAFSIVHQLQYLIVDEADRLVEQEYSGWARKLLAKRASLDHKLAEKKLEAYWDHQDWTDITKIDRRPQIPTLPTKLRLRKLLFSATLGDDPRQLTSLRLEKPLFFFVDHKNHAIITRTTKPLSAAEAAKTYSLSETLLSEDLLVADAQTKPLYLLALLEDFFETSQTVALIFANAVDTVLRVAALLKIVFEDSKKIAEIFELSSNATALQRSLALKRAKGEQHGGADKHVVIVASDAASRGLDLATIGLVLNYDAPNDAKTYVHRLGRTARAGRPGRAITLLKRGQESTFKRMRSHLDQMPSTLTLPKARISKLAPAYREAVANLKTKLADMRGKNNKTT